MSKGVLFIAFVMMLGFLIWNIFLMGQVSDMKDEVKSLQEQLDVCNGDVDILSYDLETSRDSVRILNSEIETIVSAQ
jgi:hypothetical protein